MKKAYYVVWSGRQPGIYETWEECKAQVHGQEKSTFKKFKTLDEARAAYAAGAPAPVDRKSSPKTRSPKTASANGAIPISDSLAVDAACSGNPGVMEYRGVHTSTGEQWFHQAFPLGTNNIGEFLAIVHGLAELQRRKSKLPLYTDSKTALSWIKKKKCGSKLIRSVQTEPLFALIERAEKWLQNNSYTTPLLKWDTENWGEIPADFGRK
ncbi:ribonuclease H1 domain-containing protein [Geofilum rhodophaeum]|uniref:ribonuclease H1 domain-containing protein n=1 Tax=Geofilum rhodophaeum TaxID=1965019 RepID=UPI000B51F81A|nr:ribonuclease H family protein [Geofilum rhodophaeum]